MSIWFKSYALDEINKIGKNTMIEHLGIVVTEIRENSIVGRMAVTPSTKQPFGVLHGGASAAFAETLASIGANLVLDPKLYFCVGLEINANHISPAKDGEVIGEATAVHLGRTTQVWEIRITQPDGRIVCLSRMTAAVLKKEAIA